ncbi:MAG: RlpA-like double-psi beta-barrel domain-containing protein, partial [Actinomycetota bacterium]
TKVTRDGKRGRVLKTFKKKVIDGKTVAKHLVRLEVLKPAVDRVKLVGAQPEPAGGTGGGGGNGAQSGTATWYGRSGMTAAHPTLPFGTRVTVTNVANGKSVTVVIDDRGPFGSAIIDLSDDAFAQLAPLSTGIISVRLSW